MKTTITQISNIFNLLSQIDVRIFNYHHGYRYDINQNITNNFDPANDTGRLFPAVMFDIPDNIKYLDQIDYLDVREEIQVTLYFDDLQGYNNDGSQNILNPVEQWQRLKQIAEDFIANFRYLFEDKYGAGVVGLPTFVQRANLYNEKIITWEVSFQLTHAIPCTDEQYKIDPADFPDTLDEDDLERTTGTPPTACDRIISQLNDTLLLTCVLPLYNFAQVATQNALSVQQILDLKTWILPQYDFSDSVWQNLLTTQQELDLVDYLLPTVDFTDLAIQNLLSTQQKDDILEWLFPLLDFSSPATQTLVTVQQQIDLSNWLCTPPVIVPPASLIFDGANENVFALNRSQYDFDGTTPFTIAIWFKKNSFAVNSGLFSKRINLGAGYNITFQSQFLYASFINTEATNQIQVRFNLSALNTTSWYRAIIEYDGTKQATGVNCYINNVLQPQLTPIINNLTGNINSGISMAIGKNSFSGSLYWGGKIADVSIWNILLDGTDRTADYALPRLKTTPIQQANNVFFWQPRGAKYGGNNVFVFEEGSGLNVSGLPYSNNMEYTDLDLVDYPI